MQNYLELIYRRKRYILEDGKMILNFKGEVNIQIND